jgi:hypothetical protein
MNELADRLRRGDAGCGSGNGLNVGILDGTIS